MNDLAKKHCVPCEGGTAPLTTEQEDMYHTAVTNWELMRESTPHKIARQFTFKDFKEAMQFVNKVAESAEEQGHHPDMYIFYNKVKFELHTHAINGLSENDFIMAARINEIEQALHGA